MQPCWCCCPLSQWLLVADCWVKEKNIILRLLSVSACHPPNQWRLWMLLSTRKQKFSQLALANSYAERNLHYRLVIGFTQALQMAIPIDRTQANQTTPSTLPGSNSSQSNQQNYWLRLSPMSVMHITLWWKLKKERKELQSIVSYDNNMIHNLWFVVLLCKSIVWYVLLHSIGLTKYNTASREDVKITV